MKTAPLILIIPSSERRGVEFNDLSLSISNLYSQAILAAGGVPWILPIAPLPKLVAEAVRRCDGVMLTGGDDIQPELYRQRLPARLRRTVSATSPERDLLELLILDGVFRQAKPLFAICRGLQMLNAALGGTLVVDIATELPHALEHSRSDRKDRRVHDVVLEGDSLLGSIFRRRTLGVNSSHHQAVGRVAVPLRVTAWSQDGVIEGLELRPWARGLLPYLLAVQFHPERLIGRYPEFLGLFSSFTHTCAGRHPRVI